MGYINTRTKVCVSNDKTGECVWINLPATEDTIEEVLNGIGCSFDANEYEFVKVSDWDKVFGEQDDDDEEEEGFAPFSIENVQSEYAEIEAMDDIVDINDLVNEIENLPDYEEEALKALLEEGHSIEDSVEKINDNEVEFYPGKTLAQVAEDQVKDGYYDKDFLMDYIDFEALAEYLKDSGYAETDGGVLYAYD